MYKKKYFQYCLIRKDIFVFNFFAYSFFIVLFIFLGSISNCIESTQLPWDSCNYIDFCFGPQYRKVILNTSIPLCRGQNCNAFFMMTYFKLRNANKIPCSLESEGHGRCYSLHLQVTVYMKKLNCQIFSNKIVLKFIYESQLLLILFLQSNNLVSNEVTDILFFSLFI